MLNNLYVNDEMCMSIEKVMDFSGTLINTIQYNTIILFSVTSLMN